jgi:hypothetical protein
LSQQIINIGAAPDDGTGDANRTAWDKANQNFTELYSGTGSSTEGVWNFNQTSTDTTTAPASGRFRTNSGDAATCTQLAIHRISINGVDRANTLRTQGAGDIIKMQDKVDADTWARLIVQAPPVDNGTWFQIDVAFDDGGGTPPGNNQEIIFAFTASGGGSGGGNVSNVGTPTNGQLAQWTDATHIQGIAASTITTGFAPLASPTFTGDPKAPTPTAGDNDTSIATTAFVTAAVTAAGGGGGGSGAGQLQFINATALKFAPYNGNQITINGAAKSIPAAGVSMANTSVFVNGTAGQNLAADTTYYVYLFDNGGILTADFSTTGHATSSTAGNVGIEIKSGNDTRSLIGMIRTNASSQFVDSGANRYVLSWFNRRAKSAVNNDLAASASTTSTTFVEVNSSLRTNFLMWAGDEIFWRVTALVGSAAPNYGVGYSVGFDGVTAEAAQIATNASYLNPAGFSASKSGLSEGQHYMTMLFVNLQGTTAYVYAGSAPWAPPVLTVEFWG